MSRATVDRCLEILARNAAITKLDITGGAPELNPHFDYFVEAARRLGKHVMVRHNLTVTIDGNPQTGESKRHLPEFFARHRVEVISSLPYFQEFFTDKQRGNGVFKKSVESLRLLNEQGYGKSDGAQGFGLTLNLVYNPVGAFLPASQESLERRFKKELEAKFGVVFNSLFTITNMPINRFKKDLERLGAYEEYMARLDQRLQPGGGPRRDVSLAHQRRPRRPPLRLRLQPDARFESVRGIGRDGLRFRPRHTPQSQDHLRPTLLRLRGGSGQQLRRRDSERMISI